MNDTMKQLIVWKFILRGATNDNFYPNLFIRTVNVLGIGVENIIRVKFDKLERMDVEALEIAIQTTLRQIYRQTETYPLATLHL